jgi:hypothetical protein
MFLGKKLKQQYKIRKHQIFKANLPYISRFPIVNQFVCSVLRVKQGKYPRNTGKLSLSKNISVLRQ